MQAAAKYFIRNSLFLGFRQMFKRFDYLLT